MPLLCGDERRGRQAALAAPYQRRADRAGSVSVLLVDKTLFLQPPSAHRQVEPTEGEGRDCYFSTQSLFHFQPSGGRFSSGFLSARRESSLSPSLTFAVPAHYTITLYPAHSSAGDFVQVDAAQHERLKAENHGGFYLVS